MEDKIKTRIYSRARTFLDSDIYLVGALGPPEDYLDEFQAIREAAEGDHINIFLNGPGGYLNTAQQFINVIHNTKAQVICHIEGECHSALTIIFLAAHNWVVNHNCIMLIHNYSGGAYGKGQDILQNVVANDKHVNTLFASMYEGFLSEEEIIKVQTNQDIWLDMEEINKRLEDVIVLRDLQHEEHEVQLRADMEKQIRVYNENSSENSGDIQSSTKEL